MVKVNLRPCVGCGALVPEIDGPTHRYLGASPGCWAVYGEVLEREYGDYRYWPVHRLTVDAYAVQHPGEPSPQTIQSVVVHLISLYLVLERDRDPNEATKAMQQAATRKQGFAWLDPPASLGKVTVLYVRDAKNPAEHTTRVREWARSAWQAWASYHETVRRWADD